MTTVIEEYPTEEQRSVLLFMGSGIQCKGYSKEIFPVYGGKCFLRKAFHNGSKYFADDEEVKTEVRKSLRQQSKDFYVAGFDALVRRRDKCVSVLVEYMSRNKCFTQFRISYILRFIFICDLFTDPSLIDPL
jgi:hypothetical protein